MPTDNEISVSIKVAAAKKILAGADNLEVLAPDMGELEQEARRLAAKMREFGSAASAAAYGIDKFATELAKAAADEDTTQEDA